MSRLMVLDCETTGVDPETCEVVEVAGVLLEQRRGRWKIKADFSTLIKPKGRIPPEARAIHHISDDDVARAPDLSTVVEGRIDEWAPAQPVAHNAEFDSRFLPVSGDWICTWRCAKAIWPDSPSHSNQCLRYWLELFSEPEIRAMPPHRAMADAWVTAHVLLRMLEDHTPDQLLEITRAPLLLRTVHFGKWRGKRWEEVEKSYLDWILSKQTDFDRDVVHTARHHRG